MFFRNLSSAREGEFELNFYIPTVLIFFAIRPIVKVINWDLSGSCRERKIGILLLSIFEKLC